MTALVQPTPDPRDPDPAAERVARRVERQFEGLDRLRAIGLNLAERIDRVSAGEASKGEARAFAGQQDIVLAFARLSRAVRQIIVLEQEMMGLRAPPAARASAGAAGRGTGGALDFGRREAGFGAERNDLRDPRDPSDYNDHHDYGDYDNGSRDEVVKRIYEVLSSIKDGKLGAGSEGTADGDPKAPAAADGEDWRVFASNGGGRAHFGRGPP